MTVQRACLVTGVGIAAGAGLLLEVVLTRLFSVLLGHHHAILAVSLGLFGAALGGIVVYLVPSIVRPPRLFARLGYLAGFASATAVASMIFLMAVPHIKPEIGPSIGRFALLYVVCALPFVGLGAILAGSLRHCPREMVGRIYAADLIGAGIGAVASVPLLQIGAPRAALVVAIVLAVAAILFGVGSAGRAGTVSAHEVPAPPSVISAFLLAAGCLLLGDLGSDPWASVPSTSALNMRRVEYSTWSVLSFVTVDRPVRGIAWMRTDGRGTSGILAADTEVTRHPDEMAYELHGAEGPVLIIGPGGGREVRAALDAGQTDIVGAEVDPAIVHDVMLGRYKEFSGGLFERKGVEVVVADGRAFARASGRSYRAILLSLVDSAAAGSEPLALSENGLYTVEAVTDFLGALTDDGTIVINRWDKEFERLLGLSAAGLRRFGVDDPAAHMFACSHARSTSLLVKRTPLDKVEIGKLRKYCRDRHYKEIFAADKPGSERAQTIASGEPVARAASTDPDVSPPTDDRPFFFYGVHADRVPSLLGDLGALAREQPDLWTVITLFLGSAVVGLFLLVIPLVARPRLVLGSAHRSRLLSALAFFGATGVGFALVEVVLASRLGIFLGHPVYALTVAVATLLVAGGVGSLGAARVRVASAEGLGSRLGQALVVVLIGLAVGLDPLLDATRGLPLSGRIALAVALSAVPGVLMGTQLPLGLRLVAVRSDDIVPWCLGVSGAAAVVGTALALFVALHYGFSVILLFAGLCYFLGSVFLPPLPAEPAQNAGPSSRSSVPAA